MIKVEPRSRAQPALRALQRLLAPGARMMQNLRMPAKLGLMAASLLIPLVLLMGSSMRKESHLWDYTSSEQDGVRVAEAITDVVLATQNHRGLNQRVQSGDAAAMPLRDKARAALREAIATLDATSAAPTAFSVEDLWRPVREGLETIATGRHAADPEEAFAQHAASVEALRRLLFIVGERSGLLLDPEAVAFYLMDVKLNHLVALAEAAESARSFGSGLIVAGNASPAERAGMVERAGDIERGVRELDARFAALGRAGGAVPGAWVDMRVELLRFARSVREAFTSRSMEADPAPFYDGGSAVLVGISSLQGVLTQSLAGELAQRKQRIRSDSLKKLTVFGGGLLALAYLLAAFSVTFRAGLLELRTSAAAIAEGNLSRRVNLPGRDELSSIGQDLDRMSNRLSSLVAEIRSSASMVSQTGQEVSDGSSQDRKSVV